MTLVYHKEKMLFFSRKGKVLFFALLCLVLMERGQEIYASEKRNDEAKAEKDVTPPVIKGVKKLTFFIGDKVDYKKGVTVSDNSDKNPKLEIDTSKVHPKKEGTYPILYTATDASANKRVVEGSVTFQVKDDKAPVIKGVEKLVAHMGAKISYTKDIQVTDNIDKKPKIEVDTQKVNPKKLGTYPISYTATDAAGNKTVVNTTIEIKEALIASPKTEKKMDRVLKRILKKGMTQEEKVVAIYDWMKKNIRYTETTETKYGESVDRAFTRYSGDCFVYAATAQGLLTKAGIENRYITRKPKDFIHNWNIVKVNGKWSHFDACPRRQFYQRIVMMSDKDLMEISKNLKYFRYAFTYDRSAYPKID